MRIAVLKEDPAVEPRVAATPAEYQPSVPSTRFVIVRGIGPPGAPVPLTIMALRAW